VTAPVFLLLAVLVVAAALTVVAHPSPVYSACALVVTLFLLSVFFVALDAQLVAVLQVIVYAGAIVVLFLFVIMLLGVDEEENVDVDPLKGQRPTALILGVVAAVEIVLLGYFANWVTGQQSVAGQASGPGSNVEKLARSLFTRYLLPFEVTSVLLVIAVVGAVVLARRPQRMTHEGGDAEQDELDEAEAELETASSS